jgi:hypothetical protein
MPIEVSQPVTQPSASFTAWWINGVQIAAPAPTKQASVRVTMTPYDPTTGLQQQGASKSFLVEDLFGAASADPTTGASVSAAIAALLAAVNAIAAQRSLL